MYLNNEKDKTSAKAIATLRWNEHSSHRELLAEFYHFNKYYLTEQMKDAIIDALECLDFADKAQAMLTDEPTVSYSIEVKNARMDLDGVTPTICSNYMDGDGSCYIDDNPCECDGNIEKCKG